MAANPTPAGENKPASCFVSQNADRSPEVDDHSWQRASYVSAVGVFYLVPSLVLYLAAQRYLMQMSIGGVKG